ncbi:MAG: ParB/RepB/Spo0J family partition protein, partial [Dehalococcoidia bacterium]
SNLARTDFRATAARRLSEERELSPAILSLLSPDRTGHSSGVRMIPLGQIAPNPQQPRLVFEAEALVELAASIREHGVLQPILVRPRGDNEYEIIAGERRWRASKTAGMETIPALVEDIDDETALEISIIENLQREDLTPLDEAAMYDRMVREHGYSVRKLAQKLGKDKGYLENRLRLADAPDDVRELVSLRKDTLSHAYELMKVQDPKKRKRLGQQVARGELTLLKLRDRIEGRPRSSVSTAEAKDATGPETASAAAEAEAAWTGKRPVAKPLRDDSLINAKQQLAEAIEGLVDVLRAPDVVATIGPVDRANLAKYLTIAKLKLENTIAMIRSGEIE